MKPHYLLDPMVWNAFLFNTRNADLRTALGGEIPEGTIVEGEQGYVVSEHRVLGWQATVALDWKPGRRVRWQGRNFPCMAHAKTPLKHTSRSELQRIKVNYVVAGTDDSDFARQAVKTGFPFIHKEPGLYLFNLEIGKILHQDRRRIADIIAEA